jgi:AcrR family transcriptional regulator
MLTDRQLEIIQTSIKLISSRGIQGLTMKNLSKEIGISEPAIYRHYDNKIEILVSILDYFSSTTQTIFFSEMQKEGTSLEKIERIFINHFKAFSETPSLVAVIFSEEIFRNEPLLSEKVKEIMERNSKVIQTILEEGMLNR